MSQRKRLSKVPAEQRKVIAREIVKLIAIAAGLFAVYFALPLDHLTGVPLSLTLGVALLLLGVVTSWQVLAVIDAQNPSARAIEALVGIIPLFLILFASAYYVLEQVDTGSFSSSLTRGDSLYFTVTVFSTVGFGDIVAKTEVARLIVTFQMILNIVILGLGVRVLTRAVQIGNERRKSGQLPEKEVAASDHPGEPDDDGNG